jgi:phosphomannomutase
VAPDQLTLHFDGIAAALRILAMLNRLHMSPDDFRRSMPAAVRQRAHVDIPFPHRAHALQRLNNMLRPDTPGRYHFVRGQDHAWILPDEDEPRRTVLAEAADAETAAELCAFYEQILRQAVSSES